MRQSVWNVAGECQSSRRSSFSGWWAAWSSLRWLAAVTASTSPQVVHGISTNPLDIYTRFEYCAMRYSSVPLSTSLQWQPGSPHNEVTMSLYQDYDVTHRVTGKRDASSTPQVQSKYAVSIDTLEKQ